MYITVKGRSKTTCKLIQGYGYVHLMFPNHSAVKLA